MAKEDEDGSDETKTRRMYQCRKEKRESWLQRGNKSKSWSKKGDKGVEDRTWNMDTQGVSRRANGSRVKIHVQKDCLSSAERDDQLRRGNDKRKVIKVEQRWEDDVQCQSNRNGNARV